MSLPTPEEFKIVLAQLAIMAYDDDLDQLNAQIVENLAWRIEACRCTLRELERKFVPTEGNETFMEELKGAFEDVVKALEANGYLPRSSERPPDFFERW